MRIVVLVVIALIIFTVGFYSGTEEAKKVFYSNQLVMVGNTAATVIKAPLDLSVEVVKMPGNVVNTMGSIVVEGFRALTYMPANIKRMMIQRTRNRYM